MIAPFLFQLGEKSKRRKSNSRRGHHPTLWMSSRASDLNIFWLSAICVVLTEGLRNCAKAQRGRIPRFQHFAPLREPSSANPLSTGMVESLFFRREIPGDELQSNELPIQSRPAGDDLASSGFHSEFEHRLNSPNDPRSVAWRSFSAPDIDFHCDYSRSSDDGGDHALAMHSTDCFGGLDFVRG